MKAFSVQNISDGPDEKKIETKEADEDENKPVKKFDIFDDSRSMSHVNKPFTVKLEKFSEEKFQTCLQKSSPK